jgi:hypothetical protein
MNCTWLLAVTFSRERKAISFSFLLRPWWLPKLRAWITAVIRRHHLPALTTRDDDFDHVESLDVYKP